MWESRVLGEISKSLWKPFCGFHRDVISIAVFAGAGVIEADAEGMLYPVPACRSSSLAPPARSFLIRVPV
jgi:hypothetical protein